MATYKKPGARTALYRLTHARIPTLDERIRLKANPPGSKRIIIRKDSDAHPEMGTRPVSEWDARIARFISHRVRSRRKAKADTAPQKQDPELLQIGIREIESMIPRAANAREQGRAQDQLHIWKACQHISAMQDGRKPTAFQIISALAFNPQLHGITHPRFLHAIETMSYVYRSTPAAMKSALPWVGDPSNFLRTLPSKTKNQHLPESIWRMLLRSNGKVFYSSEIMSELGMARNKTSYTRINTALQFLELIGAVRKQYSTTLFKRDQESSWASAHTSPIKRAYQNTILHILETAYGSQQQGKTLKLSDLYYRLNGGFEDMSLRAAVEKMQQMGLATTVPHPQPGPRTTSTITLTPDAMRYAKAWVETLIGQPLNQPAHEQMRRKLIHHEINGSGNGH